jgi:uncharacterized protein (TIGR02001 family)
MLRLLKSTLVLGAAASLLVVPTASAQVTVGADVGIFSQYVWRGLTLTSKPVAQPDLYLSLPIGTGSITAGGWGNVELGQYDDTDDISEGGGSAGPDLTEFDWWAEYGNTLGKATYALGVTGYVYPNDFGLTSDNNTLEIYGKLAFANVLSPRINAYYDVDEINGLYVEGAVGYDVPLSEAISLTFGALAGFNAGQGINESDPNESANFNESGFTHFDLSVASSFGAGAISITPVIHFQLSGDDFTKVNDLSNLDESTKIWFGVTLSWASGGGEE